MYISFVYLFYFPDPLLMLLMSSLRRLSSSCSLSISPFFSLCGRCLIYFDDKSIALGQRRCLRALVFFELVHRFIFWFGNTSERHYPLDRLRVVFCYFVAAYHPPKSPALPPIPVPVFGYLRFTEWLFLSLLVPPPRQLTLERQLNKSILIGWNHPEATPPESGQIACYHVYVDGILRTTVRATDRPRALIEGVDSNKVKFQSNFN